MTVGVLTPYRGQVACITEALCDSVQPREDSTVVVRTADSCIGKEYWYSVISTVRVDQDATFVAEAERANVLNSRARSIMVYVGCRRTMQILRDTRAATLERGVSEYPFRAFADAAVVLRGPTFTHFSDPAPSALPHHHQCPRSFAASRLTFHAALIITGLPNWAHRAASLVIDPLIAASGVMHKYGVPRDALTDDRVGGMRDSPLGFGWMMKPDRAPLRQSTLSWIPIIRAADVPVVVTGTGAQLSERIPWDTLRYDGCAATPDTPVYEVQYGRLLQVACLQVTHMPADQHASRRATTHYNARLSGVVGRLLGIPAGDHTHEGHRDIGVTTEFTGCKWVVLLTPLARSECLRVFGGYTTTLHRLLAAAGLPAEWI